MKILCEALTALLLMLAVLSAHMGSAVEVRHLVHHKCDGNPWHRHITQDLEPFDQITRESVDAAEAIIGSGWNGGWRVVILKGKTYLKALQNENTLIKKIGIHLNIMTPQMKIIMTALRQAKYLPNADFVINTGDLDGWPCLSWFS